MQTITVKSIQEKASRSDPSKKFWVVCDTSGADFTTFDNSVASLLPGAVIEADIKVDGKYKNLGTFTLMKQGTAEPPPPDIAKAEDRDARIERQVAVKCAFELRESGVTLDENEKRVYNAALGWVASHLGVTIVPEPPKTAGKAVTTSPEPDSRAKLPPSPTPAPTAGSQEGKVIIKTAAELWTWAQSKGLNVADIRHLLGQIQPSSSKDLPGEYARLLAEIKRRHEAKPNQAS